MNYAPRVKETTTTEGTATYSLAGAETGFQSFTSALGGSEQTWYCCTDDIDWEIGVGTVTDSSPDTLSRDIITESSNSGSAVDWSAGTKNIFCIFPPNLLKCIQGDWDAYYSEDANTFTRSETDYQNTIIGSANSIAGAKNTIIGHFNKVKTGVDKAIVFGIECNVEANAISNPGIVYSSGRLYTFGDTQLKIRTACVITTDATESGCGFFALAGSTSNTGTALYEISVVARQRSGYTGTIGDSKSWKLDCMVTFASGVLAQVGTTVSSVIGQSAGASAWTCEIDVSENAEEGPIRVTGEANKTIHWAALIRQLENSTGLVPPT